MVTALPCLNKHTNLILTTLQVLKQSSFSELSYLMLLWLKRLGTLETISVAPFSHFMSCSTMTCRPRNVLWNSIHSDIRSKGGGICKKRYKETFEGWLTLPDSGLLYISLSCPWKWPDFRTGQRISNIEFFRIFNSRIISFYVHDSSDPLSFLRRGKGSCCFGPHDSSILIGTDETPTSGLPEKETQFITICNFTFLGKQKCEAWLCHI